MEMAVIYKIGGAAIATGLISQILTHSGKATEGNIVAIIGAILVMIQLVYYIIQFFQVVDTLVNM